ncbi:MAG: helix-turn-helix domain-containing protein [Pseudomonadota bacterium]
MGRPARTTPADPGTSARQPQNNRSLARGLELLSTFTPGVAALGNAELAERVGLPRSTVSRLTQSLVQSGFLDHDRAAGTYRLAPRLLGLGLAMQQGSEVFQTALPQMRHFAEGRSINVGLAVRDGTDMVYLTSVRKSRSELFRHVTAGSRIPVALTALGRAWLSTLAPVDMRSTLAELKARHPLRWDLRRRDIELAVANCREHGYCSATWQTGIVSVAMPLPAPGLRQHVFNASVLLAGRPVDDWVRELLPPLRELVGSVEQALARRAPAE